MFAVHCIRLSNMNHSAKNSICHVSQTLGYSDSMMCGMSMIMRQPSGGVIIHVV